MNAGIPTTRVADGTAVITLGSARRIYFDEEMGDALTETLDGFAGDPNVRVVIVTGGAPGYFNRHSSIPVLIQTAESLRASGRQCPRTPLTNGGFFDKAMAPCESMAQGLALERNLFLKLCISEPALARMRSYEEKKITSPSRSVEV